MTAPVSVWIGSLTAPAGRVKATASTAGLMPASPIGAPRAMSSVVFDLETGGLGGRLEVAGLQLRRQRRGALPRRIGRLVLDDVVAHARLDLVERRVARGLACRSP